MLLRRWRNRIVLIVGVLILALASALVFTQPVLAAAVCPSCFGFDQLSGRVYVDHAMSAEQRRDLNQALAQAAARVTAFYGDTNQAPVVLACATDACDARLHGGSARGAAYLTFALRLAPRGLNPTIIAHERSHIALHARIGLWRYTEVPAWFDEGLAVVVSDDTRYLLPAGAGDRCRVEPGDALPADRRDWRRTAGHDTELYARAACEVIRWIDHNGGRTAVLALAQRMHDGARFADAYEHP